MSLILFLLAIAAEPQDTMAATIVGLYAVVEEDDQPDRRLLALRTSGCTTRVTAEGRSWTVDWRKADAVALEDTFVFVSAPPVKLAIVGDASKPDQAAKLSALHLEMLAAARRCAKAQG